MSEINFNGSPANMRYEGGPTDYKPWEPDVPVRGVVPGAPDPRMKLVPVHPIGGLNPVDGSESRPTTRPAPAGAAPALQSLAAEQGARNLEDEGAQEAREEALTKGPDPILYEAPIVASDTAETPTIGDNVAAVVAEEPVPVTRGEVEQDLSFNGIKSLNEDEIQAAQRVMREVVNPDGTPKIPDPSALKELFKPEQ